METVIVENEMLRLEFDRANGALVRMRAVESGWEILNRPHLGLSFKLMVPLPDRRSNHVLGEKQKITSILGSDDHRSVTFIWDGVDSEFGGHHEIKLFLQVQLAERKAIFTLTIENKSEHVVENVYNPYFGDLQPAPNEAWLKTFIWHIHGAEEWPVWPTFKSLRGYYGTDHPTQMSPSPIVGGDVWVPVPPFLLLRGAQQGLYVGLHEHSHEMVAWQLQLHPGWTSYMDANVPEGGEISGHEVAIRFAAVHVPYILSGEKRTLTPIALRPYQGDWQEGVDIYKRWRDGWSKPPKAPAWTNDPHSWQQIGLNSAEDDRRYTYRDLVQIGKDCVRHGVKAIQVVGWHYGGLDRNWPNHIVDPRLGTEEDLRTAIAEVKAMGVKVILYCKYTWADRSTERFRKELIKYAIKDPYGDYYHHPGYQMTTATQLLDINTRRNVPMCFLSDDYLEICNQEFGKLLALDPDGMLFDECLHHSPAFLCFDESHGHRYAAPVYAHDNKLIENFSHLTATVNGEFLFSGEAVYDWEFEAYHMAYVRTPSPEHVPLLRYVRPHVPIMATVVGFNDRNLINQCLMYRYIISYEPLFFKGSLDDFPLTVAYGHKMDTLRTELREFFWDGEFDYQRGAKVTRAGQPYRPYSVFLSQETGKLGVVVVNYSYEDEIVVFVEADDERRLERYRLVDYPEWSLINDGVTIPPCSAAVVI